MTTTERWKPVVGYPGYEVSSHGQVRSVPRIDARGNRRKGVTLRPGTRRSGHKQVGLRKEGRTYSIDIHRLMLIAFVGPPPIGMEARHLNDVPSDNRLENLRWGTRSENIQDRIQNGILEAHLRTHCPRGHALKEPNLNPSAYRRGVRGCFACATARGRSLRGKTFQEIADDVYAEILAGRAPRGHYRDRKRCIRGHLLQNPNLVRAKIKKGYRECLACAREHSMSYNRGERFDANRAHSRYYELIPDDTVNHVEGVPA